MKATTIRMIWGTAASMRICFSFQGILLSTTLVHGMSLDPPLAKPFTAAAIISKNNNNQANSCVEDTVPLSRRRAFQSLARVATGAGTASVISQSGFPGAALADDDSTTATTNAPTVYDFHNRDRKGNAQAVIRDDYWYILGKTPPQLLTTQLKGDDPQWNAFGSCSTSEATGTNSCTYVSLNQRIPAYSKYASSIAYGAREYQQLGGLLLKSGTTANNDKDWWTSAEAYVKTEAGLPPPAAVDAELKMVLFATAMLTSPNFPGPSRELLVARFYANEVRHANREILYAARSRDLNRAAQAWTFGRDSWNSYFQVVARQIVPKVGEPFQSIV